MCALCQTEKPLNLFIEYAFSDFNKKEFNWCGNLFVHSKMIRGSMILLGCKVTYTSVTEMTQSQVIIKTLNFFFFPL